MQKVRPTYAFDVEGRTVVTPAKETKDATQVKHLVIITGLMVIPTFMVMSNLFGVVDALAYLSGILMLSIAAGITLQRIEDKQKGKQP